MLGYEEIRLRMIEMTDEIRSKRTDRGYKELDFSTMMVWIKEDFLNVQKALDECSEIIEQFEEYEKSHEEDKDQLQELYPMAAVIGNAKAKYEHKLHEYKLFLGK